MHEDGLREGGLLLYVNTLHMLDVAQRTTPVQVWNKKRKQKTPFFLNFPALFPNGFSSSLFLVIFFICIHLFHLL